MYCYAGISQFGEEKCGDAIRSLNEAQASALARPRTSNTLSRRLPVLLCSHLHEFTFWLASFSLAFSLPLPLPSPLFSSVKTRHGGGQEDRPGLREDSRGIAGTTRPHLPHCLQAARYDVDRGGRLLRPSGPGKAPAARGMAVFLTTHLLARVSEKVIKEHSDKYNRENGFIYTQRIPTVAPEPPEPKCLTEVSPALETHTMGRLQAPSCQQPGCWPCDEQRNHDQLE